MKKNTRKILAVIIAVMVLISIYPSQKTEAVAKVKSGTIWYISYDGKNGKSVRVGEGSYDAVNRITSSNFYPKNSYSLYINSLETKTFNFVIYSFGKYKQVDGSGIKGNVMFLSNINKWRHDKKGWWFGAKSNYATNGFYLISSSKIENYTKDTGIYYFVNGYMVKNQFRNGYWLGKDGKLSLNYSCKWHKDGKGSWYGGGTWYAKNGTYKIDGKTYRFNKKGYVY